MMRAILIALFAQVLWAGGGQAAPASSSSLDRLLEAARQAEARRDYAAASKSYADAVESHPQSAELWQRLGLTLHLQNRFDESVPAFERAVEIDSSLWGSRLFLGMGLYRLNRFDVALEQLEAADRLRPEDPEIRFWLGVTLLALGRDLEGLAGLEDAAARQPGKAETWRLLAQRYSEYSAFLRNQLAERHFESPWGQLVYAQVLEAEGREELAAAAYEAALEIEPALPSANAALGRILLSKGDTSEAMSRFRREIEIEPNDVESRYQLGLYALEADELDEAAEHLEIAAAWSVESAGPALALARALSQAGKPHEAARAATLAVEAEPSSESAHQLFVALHREAGDSEAVLKEERRWAGVRSGVN